MSETKAKESVDFTFRDIFGRENPFSLEQIRKKFAFDVNLPERVKEYLGGQYTWTASRKKGRFVSTKAAIEQSKKNLWMKPKKHIGSIEDIIKYWGEISYLQGENNMESVDVDESDHVYQSSNVFRSSRVYGSQNIVFSEDIARSNYIVAGYNDTACTSGIRMAESTSCSSGFQVIWSKKVSKSMFVYGSLDLYECLFCSNIESKKYCIANMQFTKEEYSRIKAMVVDWIIRSFDKSMGLE